MREKRKLLWLFTIGSSKNEDENDDDYTPLDTSSIIDTMDLSGWKL